MKNTVLQLRALQEIDSQLQEITDLLGDLPGKVSALKEEETALSQSVEDGKTRIKDLKISLDKSELSMAEIKEKINKYKDQLFLVTNNKQYDALQHEIDHLKTELDSVETASLESEEEKDALKEKVKSAEENLETLSKDLITRRERLETLMAESSEKKLNLENQRKSEISTMDMAILNRYNRVLAARDGLAVMRVESGACGGCGSKVPPQVMAEIRIGKTIYNCDVCGRFLYWEKPE